MALLQYTSLNGYKLSDLESQDPDEFGNEEGVFSVGSPSYGQEIAIIASSRGEWGNYIQIAIVGRNAYQQVRAGVSATTVGVSATLYDDIDNVDIGFSSDRQFLIIVKAAKQENTRNDPIPYEIVETWLVSSDPTEVNDEGVNIFVENYINTNSEYIRVATSTSFKNQSYYSKGTPDYVNLGGGIRNKGTLLDADIIESYELYQDPEAIDVNIVIDSNKSTTVKQAIVTMCEERADAVAILDVPRSLVINNQGNEANDCRDYRLGQHPTYNLNINSSYAATYANWLDIFDKWSSRYRWVPASGHVAGIYANTDQVSETWFAPAGLNRAIIDQVRRLAGMQLKGKEIYYTKMVLIQLLVIRGKVL
jgi:phage tail sheath protein FI